MITFFKGNFYDVVFVCLIDDNKKPRAEAILHLLQVKSI